MEEGSFSSQRAETWETNGPRFLGLLDSFLFLLLFPPLFPYLVPVLRQSDPALSLIPC
jgi:hypothetical protein